MAFMGSSRQSVHGPERENRVIESGVRHKLLNILAVQFVEQLLSILWGTPEHPIVPGTGEGLTDWTILSVILHVNQQPTSGSTPGFPL